jgi:molybdopterin synthase catalytic subunit
MKRLTSDPLDAGALRRAVQYPEAGAVAVFEGVVRNRDKGRRVDYLIYEAYEEMVESILQRICEDTKDRAGVHAAEARHRVGKLTVGETAVVVAVSASHRGQAFEACRYMIDEIKRLAPIWKREGNESGEEWVEAQQEGAR